MINWNKYKYFKEEDFADPLSKGSGNMIDERLLFLLDELRIRFGWPMIFHSIVGGCVDVNGSHGHAKKSYHLTLMGAKAVDFHFQTTKVHARKQFLEVIKTGFTGIGVYFDWSWNNNLLPIGFHVDLRSENKTQIWKRSSGRYIYLLK